MNNFIKMSEEEYDKFMCESFPKMFKERHMPMSQTCMCWGFNIGPGWRKILYDLCIQLNEIHKMTDILVVFKQIKEKFGSACFYYETCEGNGKNIFDWEGVINMLVSKAENMCGHTCEITGEYINGPIVDKGWVYAMSPSAFKKIKENKEENKNE